MLVEQVVVGLREALVIWILLQVLPLVPGVLSADDARVGDKSRVRKDADISVDLSLGRVSGRCS